MAYSIGQKIKDLRLVHSLTQEQLGKILGVNKSAIQKYESGDVKNLKRETIKILCNYFRVFPYHFIFEPGEYWLEKNHAAMLEGKNIVDTRNALLFYQKSFFLNEDGFDKVLEYMDDLAHVEKYKRKP